MTLPRKTLNTQIGKIKAMYADGLKGDIEITKREYEDKLDRCRTELNVAMNHEIKELINSNSTLMEQEIQELKTTAGDE